MSASTHTGIPLLYRLFFLYIEPLSTVIGAYYAHFAQEQYISLTQASYSSSPLPTLVSVSRTESIILSQLSNLYLLFALNEGLVLRATSNRRVWRTLLTGLLIADMGHLWACRAASSDGSLFWQFWNWNSMYWGNIGFVYVGACMRVCFLIGVGLGRGDEDAVEMRTGGMGKGKGKVM